MLTKKITYTNYNDVEVTETFYFNLTKTEIMELQIGTEGGIEDKLRKIAEAKNAGQLLKVFKELIIRSYGIKSDDGRYFKKGENFEYAKEFMESPAYDELILDILGDTTGEKFKSFFLGIMPKEALEEISKRGGIDKLMEEEKANLVV